MKALKIVTIPNQNLRKKSVAIDKITPKVRELADNMLATLRTKPGLGLAAPQIGKNIRLIVIESKGLKDDEGNVIYENIPVTFLVNPVILKTSHKQIEMDEGCFSVPNQFAPVRRPEKIKAIAYDLDGNELKYNTGGLLARIIQHEVDHLEGRLFIDLVEDKSKIRKYQPGEEEIGI